MSRQKVEPSKEKAAKEALEDVVKSHGLPAVRRAWNHYDKAMKEREKMLAQKREAEDAIKRIDAKLGK